MLPNITLNYFAMLAAIVAAFAFGGIWYGPLFGRTWGGLMGMKMDKKPEPAVMMKAMGLQLLGCICVVYVTAHFNPIWRPSVWNAGQDQADYIYGFLGGFFTWIGFYIPLQLNKVAWEMRPWKLFFINAAHDFINLQIISQIIAHWR